jgi:hypothetical protein
MKGPDQTTGQVPTLETFPPDWNRAAGQKHPKNQQPVPGPEQFRPLRETQSGAAIDFSFSPVED